MKSFYVYVIAASLLLRATQQIIDITANNFYGVKPTNTEWGTMRQVDDIVTLIMLFVELLPTISIIIVFFHGSVRDLKGRVPSGDLKQYILSVSDQGPGTMLITDYGDTEEQDLLEMEREDFTSGLTSNNNLIVP